MRLSPVADSKLETRVIFDSPEELDRAYPYRISLCARKMLQAMHVVKPWEFPVMHVLPIDMMYRREEVLMREQLRIEDGGPGEMDAVAELRDFRLDLGAQIRAVQQANWEPYER
jgi:hypothetical protein